MGNDFQHLRVRSRWNATHDTLSADGAESSGSELRTMVNPGTSIAFAPAILLKKLAQSLDTQTMLLVSVTRFTSITMVEYLRLVSLI